MQRLKKILQDGIICMLASALFFSIMGALVKFSLKEIPLLEVIFFRSVVSTLLLGTLIFHRGESFIGRRPILLLGRGLAGFTAIVTNFYAVSKIPLGDAAILNQTSPIFVAFLSVLFLGEKLSRKVYFLSLLSLFGVGLIVKPSLSQFNLAALLGLVSGFMAALAYVAIRELHSTDSFLTMAFYFTAITTLLSAPFTLHHFVWPRLNMAMSLLGIGLTGTLGQLLMTYAYKNEAASVVSPFSYMSVLLSFIWGMIFFGEKPDLATLIGGVLVVASCIVLSEIRNMKYVEIEERGGRGER